MPSKKPAAKVAKPLPPKKLIKGGIRRIDEEDQHNLTVVALAI
jgi:hypothetical protein